MDPRLCTAKVNLKHMDTVEGTASARRRLLAQRYKTERASALLEAELILIACQQGLDPESPRYREAWQVLFRTFRHVADDWFLLHSPDNDVSQNDG